MDLFNPLLQYLDPYLIFFFRLFDVPIWGYFSGITMLALICIGIGQVTIFTVFSVNHSAIRDQNQEMVRMQNLSVYALLAKDKKAYRVCNRQANIQYQLLQQ